MVIPLDFWFLPTTFLPADDIWNSLLLDKIIRHSSPCTDYSTRHLSTRGGALLRKTQLVEEQDADKVPKPFVARKMPLVLRRQVYYEQQVLLRNVLLHQRELC
jgi:hypothetical protein